MRRFMISTVVLLAIASARIAQAQSPVGFELRGGAAFPTEDLDDASLKTGGGVRIPMGEHFALTPGVRYRTLPADLTVGQTTVPVDLSYLTAEIGIQYSIGPARVITALVR